MVASLAAPDANSGGDFVETLPSCYLVADGLIAGLAEDAVEGAIGVWTERGSERFAVMTTSGKFKAELPTLQETLFRL